MMVDGYFFSQTELLCFNLFPEIISPESSYVFCLLSSFAFSYMICNIIAARMEKKMQIGTEKKITP